MKFDVKIFKKNIVSKLDCILLQYITGAPYPKELNKFGKTLKERAYNIENFLASDMTAYYGDGLVVDIKETFETIKNINNRKIKRRLTLLLKNFKVYAGEAVVLGKDMKNIEYNKVLHHEWIHVLVEYNNLTFKDWRYNEAFAVYLEHYFKTMDGKDLDDLKMHIKATNHKKNYGRVSRRMEKFVKLLEDKNTSQKKK